MITNAIKSLVGRGTFDFWKTSESFKQNVIGGIPKVAPPPKPPNDRGYQMSVQRYCECCGTVHECKETFREMVDRCIAESDGSLIVTG